jgi:hypothetical protein
MEVFASPIPWMGFVRGSKEEALDLTTEEKKALKAAAESELAARAVR